MRGAYGVGLVYGLAVTACSLFTSLDGYSGGVVVASAYADADADALGEASDDASLDRSVTPIGDGGDEAGVNLHPNGTLESGCAPWVSFRGTIVPSNIAHGGSGSCLVCTLPSTTDAFTGDDSSAVGADIVGGTYLAEAWVRTNPGTPGPSALAITLRNNDNNPSLPELESKSSPEVQIDATWKQIETKLDVTKQGKLNVYIYALRVPNACFLFDDVVVYRLK